MSAAKSLTPAEIQKVLQYIVQHSNPLRNRVMFLCTAQAGMRVSEVAGLTIGDVRNADGTVKSEVFLSAERVKHEHARTVYISTSLQKEVADYIETRKWFSEDQALFYTSKNIRRGFTANTMTQYFFWLYKNVGISSGSSHSGRKTFLTSLASQGISVFVLASLAGHRDIKTTARYISVNDDMKRKAVELV